MFGQLISIVLGFVSMKLLSTMGTKEFGKYSLVLTIAALISATIYGPVEQGFIRFYNEFSKNGKARTYIGLFYKFLFVVGFFCLIITVLAIFINSFLSTTEKPIGILIMGLYIIIFTSSNIYNSLLNLLRKRKTNTLIQIIEKSLVILFLYLLTLKTEITANTGLLVIILALVIVITIKTKALNTYVPKDKVADKDEHRDTRKNIIKVIATFSLPFAIWGITGWLQSNSERWVIAQYLSTADVGIFSLMAVLANYLVAIPSGIIGQFSQPIIYEKTSLKKDLREAVEGYRIFKYSVFATIGVVIFSIIFSIICGRQMILLVSNDKFVSHWYILPILCLGVGLFTIGQALTTIGIIQNIPKIYLRPKIVTGLFAILSNIIFIKQFGLVGAAISICIISTFYLFFIIYTNRKLTTT
jgi:O-antigen/teichoic acid export membrane protein